MKIFNIKYFMLGLLFLTHSTFAEQKINVGRFNSRATLNSANSSQCPRPIVIMIPGSGANGPEVMIPGSLTLDGRDHSIFSSFSDGLNRGNADTLALGKPGVEFFKSWKPEDKFYDQKMYASLEWQDLIHNLSDAVIFVKTLSCIDSSRIYILGHSEGTQVAVDFATQNPNVAKGLILVGFSGESLATTVDWQFFKRVIDVLIKTDVDTNNDGFMSKVEANLWPELSWPWKQNQEKVSFEEIEQALRSNVSLQKEFQKLSMSKLWNKIYFRNPIYSEASILQEDLYIFTGELDVQTRPEEAIKMRDECLKMQKKNCEVVLVPGLGHAMSKPKGPRGHRLLDSTLGYVDDSFIDLLNATALKF